MTLAAFVRGEIAVKDQSENGKLSYQGLSFSVQEHQLGNIQTLVRSTAKRAQNSASLFQI